MFRIPFLFRFYVTKTQGLPPGTQGGGAQGLVHWMSVMAEHMGGGHDPSHYALPPWNNGGVDVMLEAHGLDILALNETWTKEGMEKFAPTMPGYKFLNTPRPLGGRGGGVGFYIREGLRVRTRAHPPAVLEQMWVELTVAGVGRIAIGTAYRPESVRVAAAIDALSESHCQQKDGLDYAAWSRPRGAMTIKQGYEAKMTNDGSVHQKTDDRLGHHQSMSQMLYGTGLGPGRSGSSSSSPVGGNTGSGLLVVPQPLGKGPTKLQPLHAHARKYHCKMCPQVWNITI
ncbi:unnamed protein product [Colias eurytheme]|nr:unnamed protein product [Colias eurytheme]